MSDTYSKTNFEAMKAQFSDKVGSLANVKWGDLPGRVQDHIIQHPYLTTFQVVSLVVAADPSLVATPLMGTAGFSNIGPVAGSAAAWFQSTVGTPLGFSAIQSAAMGGYGVSAVNGIVQGLSLSGAAAAQWSSQSFSLKRDGQDTKGGSLLKSHL